MADFYDWFEVIEWATEPNANGERRGKCPSCNSDANKFYVNTTKLVHDCKQCGFKGSGYDFIEWMIDYLIPAWGIDANLQALSERRAETISPAVLKSLGVLFDGTYWYLPIRGPKGGHKYLNVKRCRAADEKLVWMGAPSVPVSLFGLSSLDSLPPTAPIDLCEGEWDAMALMTLAARVKAKRAILAVPGASTFKHEWADHFGTRPVTLFYDNDEAGLKGRDKAISLLTNRAPSLRTIAWTEDAPPGYDISDYCRDEGSNAKEAWDSLMAACVSTAGISDEALSESLPQVDNLNTVLDAFASLYHLNDNLRDSIAIMFAVSAAALLPTNPLWVFFVGPPGTGKTLMLEKLLSRCPACVFRSSLTGKTLISGFIGEGGSDPSLLPMLVQKTFVVKDWTEILNLPPVERDEITATLRGAYDGRAEKQFGNGVFRIYEKTGFSLAAGVTDAIHQRAEGQLGERFLKWNMLTDDHDFDDHIAQSIRGTSEFATRAEEIELLGQLGAGFVMHLRSKSHDISQVHLPPEFADRLVALVQLVAIFRATVSRNRGELTHRPRPEIATRLAAQLTNLAKHLAIVHGYDSVQPDLWRFIEKMARDTGLGWYQDVICCIGPNTVTHSQLVESADIPASTLQAKLQDLLDLKAIVRTTKQYNPPPGKLKSVGRPTLYYALSPQVLDLWNRSGIGTIPQADNG